MVVLNKKAFKLPRMDPEVFKLLMRLGLEYDRGAGVFRVVNLNNAEKLFDTLSGILSDLNVSFTQTCEECGRDFACIECRYYELCETRNYPSGCVCGKCLEEGKNGLLIKKSAG